MSPESIHNERPNERRQFRVLYRDFLSRMVDLEILSARGEIQKLLGQFAAMLAAFSLTCTMFSFPKFAMATLPHAKLIAASWSQEEFLIATSMAIAGLFAVLAWNAVLPDRRDCLVLGLMPLRVWTIARAKVAAIATALGISIVAVNLFTGLSFPWLWGSTESGWAALRSVAAYWIATAAAGLFVFCALLALQGIAAQFLSYRAFLRFSGWAQLASFFAILGVYFLKPPFPASAHTTFDWLPSFWFLGLYQEMNGATSPAFAPLALRALCGLLFASCLAAVTFALSYQRNMRRIVEQPDIAPAGRSRPATRIGSFLAARFLARPLDRAVVLFTARTMARSRQHRLLLAAYGGIGMAIAMVYAKDLLYGYSGVVWDSLNQRAPASAHWNQVNVPFLIGNLILLAFAVLGARAVFALPIALPANWIFRITAVHRPAAYFSAVRKALLALTAAPLWLAALLYFAIWPARPAAEHVAVLVVTGVMLVELAMFRFRKIPFACSYLPGKSNLNVKLGIYAIVLLIAADRGVAIEYWAMGGLVRFAMFFAILVAIAMWARRRTSEFALSPYSQIQFEDLPPADINALDLSGESGSSGNGTYIDAVEHASGTAVGHAPSVLSLFSAEPLRESRPPDIASVFEQAWKDLRYGARILTKSPAFSAAAVALIALGIGGNTTIFSLIHGVLTKPAPGIHADRLVICGLVIDGVRDDPEGGSDSLLNYLDYAAQTKTMSSLAAIAPARYTVATKNGVYELRGQLVTPNYFATLGVHLAKGREFTQAEARGTGTLPAIIAYHVWEDQFQGAEDVLGQTVTLNGRAATIVGVAPPGFHGLQFAPNLEICIPLSVYSQRDGMHLGDRSARGIDIAGRLSDGVSLAQAQAEFDAISARLRAAYPEDEKHKRIVLAPYSATVFTPVQSAKTRLFMAILMAVALLTLLIVCANVANLMLARSAARQREMAVRQSIGASRWRILRILLAEGLVLSLTACGAAWLFAVWATRALVTLIPPVESGVRVEPDLSPDWRVMAYALLLACAATVAFTMAPAVRAWRQELLPWLKAGENSVIQGRSTLANILVVAQVAMCVVLLTSAGLAWRSTSLMETTDLGFVKDRLLLATLSTKAAAVNKQQNVALLERLRMRLRAVPGVTAVSYAVNAPPRAWTGMSVRIPGSPKQHLTDGNVVGPDYLAALGAPLIAGRGISEADMSGSNTGPYAPAVVNRKLAQLLWPGQSALGKTMTVDASPQHLQVIGIVPDGAFSGIGPGPGVSGISKEERTPFVFLSEQDSSGAPGQIVFHVRYAGDLAAAAKAIRAAVREADGRVPVSSLRTMDAAWSEFTWPARLITSLLGIFGIGALLLAAIGLYAAAAFHTVRRTREFGIRAALGASRRQTLGLVLKEGLLITGIGIGVGVLLSAGVGKAFGGLLFGVSPGDKPTYLAVIGLLALVSLLACYLPARRAAAVDPMRALRQD